MSDSSINFAESGILLTEEEFNGKQFDMASWKVYLVDSSLTDLESIEENMGSLLVLEIGTLGDLIKELRHYRAASSPPPPFDCFGR